MEKHNPQASNPVRLPPSQGHSIRKHGSQVSHVNIHRPDDGEGMLHTLSPVPSAILMSHQHNPAARKTCSVTKVLGNYGIFVRPKFWKDVSVTVY